MTSAPQPDPQNREPDPVFPDSAQPAPEEAAPQGPSLQEAPNSQDFACPHCSQEVRATPELLAYEIACPACGQAFVVPSLSGSTELADPAEEAEHRAREREDELSGLRMRQISATRRSAIRTQTYFVIGAVLCIVCAIQCLIRAILLLRETGWHLPPLGYAKVGSYVVLALFGTWGSIHCARRASYWNRQSHLSALDEPPARAPDFSTLSDGSQQYKKLEDVR